MVSASLAMRANLPQRRIEAHALFPSQRIMPRQPLEYLSAVPLRDCQRPEIVENL
jgi:hypothetical protein